MKLSPAIDLLGGRAVRLYKGDYEKKTDYGDPASIARMFQEQGARDLHVVDLDGAREGHRVNQTALSALLATGLSLELGGGIRTRDDARALLDQGFCRLVIGSLAAEKPDVLRELIREFGPERIVVGLDARNGFVATRGWTVATRLTTLAFASFLETVGVTTVIYTAISKDGTLSGPDLEGTGELVKGTRLAVIASGGIRNQADLDALRDRGASGAILGKSLYEGTLDLSRALRKEEGHVL